MFIHGDGNGKGNYDVQRWLKDAQAFDTGLLNAVGGSDHDTDDDDDDDDDEEVDSQNPTVINAEY
ncbi:hypothetical protein LTR28_012537 [Elasticomyces elasticus]|nr:hypothetical protein LTR28_012537 [Elasticomyces elasticus]